MSGDTPKGDALYIARMGRNERDYEHSLCDWRLRFGLSESLEVGESLEAMPSSEEGLSSFLVLAAGMEATGRVARRRGRRRAENGGRRRWKS